MRKCLSFDIPAMLRSLLVLALALSILLAFAYEVRAETKQGTQVVQWPYAAGEPKKEELAEKLTARNFVLVFDGSGSMQEKRCSGQRTKLEVAKDAVVEWSSTVPADANIGLVAFHDNTWSKLPVATGNRDQFIRIVGKIAAGGGTPLDEAVSTAYDMLTQQAQRQLGYGQYTIVVVTDGMANNPAALTAVVNRILAGSPIVVYSIGFCIGPGHSLNQRGRTIYKTANDPVALRRGLKDVLAEAETFDVSDFGKK